MEPPNPRVWRLVLTGTALLAFLGLLSLALDWRELRRLAADTNWVLMPVALGLSALSYAALSYAFALVSVSVGIAVPRRTLLAVGFVSIALSQVAAVGGVAGISVRLALLRGRGSHPGDVLAASLMYSSLSHLVLLALLPAALAYLLVVHPLSGRAMAAIAMAVGLLLTLLALITATLFVERARRPLLGLIARGSRRWTGRHGMATALDQLDAGLTAAAARLRSRPLQLAAPLALIAAEWGLAATTLGLCFGALGPAVRPAVLLTGLTVGVAAGLLSMLPGGLGTQDGSMTGVYVLLGVPLEQAILAAILFRLVYYAFPFSASLALYRRLQRPTASPAVPEAQP
jgi:uncharacterized protein (TIRG00374 family)